LKCAHCKHFDIELHPSHRAASLGLCTGFPKLRARFVTLKADKDCKRFKQETEEIIQKRRDLEAKMNADNEARQGLFLQTDDPIVICAEQVKEIDRLNVLIAKQADQIEQLTIDNAFLSGRIVK
jgi:hypothetical protein